MGSPKSGDIGYIQSPRFRALKTVNGVPRSADAGSPASHAVKLLGILVDGRWLFVVVVHIAVVVGSVIEGVVVEIGLNRRLNVR